MWDTQSHSDFSPWVPDSFISTHVQVPDAHGGGHWIVGTFVGLFVLSAEDGTKGLPYTRINKFLFTKMCQLALPLSKTNTN